MLFGGVVKTKTKERAGGVSGVDVSSLVHNAGTYPCGELAESIACNLTRGEKSPDLVN
jgi:hypothetical protein